MKWCSGCNQNKSLEGFHKDKRAKDGRTSRCKECRCKAENLRYKQDPEPKRKNAKLWALRNPERKKENHRRWCEENREHVRDLWNNWYKNNPESQRLNNKKGYEKNKARYYFRVKRRRAMKNNQLGESLPDEAFIKDQLLKQNNLCFYCEQKMEKMELDHCTPLSRGGLHDTSNIVLSCMPCNRSKFTKTAEEFLKKKPA